MLGLSIQELLIVLIIILLVFGGKKIPELAKNLGKALREFKKGVKEVENDINVDQKPDNPE